MKEEVVMFTRWMGQRGHGSVRRTLEAKTAGLAKVHMHEIAKELRESASHSQWVQMNKSSS